MTNMMWYLNLHMLQKSWGLLGGQQYDTHTIVNFYFRKLQMQFHLAILQVGQLQLMQFQYPHPQ